MPLVPAFHASAPRSDDLKQRVAELCAAYGASRDDQALVRSLCDAKSAFAHGARKAGEDMYTLSILLKRVEKTCNKHFCGLWNEVRVWGGGACRVALRNIPSVGMGPSACAAVASEHPRLIDACVFLHVCRRPASVPVP